MSEIIKVILKLIKFHFQLFLIRIVIKIIWLKVQTIIDYLFKFFAKAVLLYKLNNFREIHEQRCEFFFT